MISSDINPLSRQKEACLRSAGFHGASRRETVELFSQLLEFWTVSFWTVFSVWSGGTCLSFTLVFTTVVTGDKRCSPRDFLIPKWTSAIFQADYRGAFSEESVCRTLCLANDLVKSVCKWVLRSFLWCSSTDTSGVVFDTRSKMVMWQGGTTERMKEKVRRLTRSPSAAPRGASHHKCCSVSRGF